MTNKTREGTTMKKFCFTVDDNIQFFAHIVKEGYDSIFDHPYLAMYKRLHERFGVKVQLNLYYVFADFTLADFPDKYKEEWRANSDWLKLSFHSYRGAYCPYENSGYDEVYNDCSAVNREIVRFASEDALGKTTTIHYCLNTPEGVEALKDCGVKGLLGLFGRPENPRTSYSIPLELTDGIRLGKPLNYNGITFGALDLILNGITEEAAHERLEWLSSHEQVHLMIHEQFFYPDYPDYMPNFEDMLSMAFTFMSEHGFEPDFYENMI